MTLARLFIGILLLLASVTVAAADLGFDRLERSLHLKPDQKEQFDAAVGATQRALLMVALAGMQMKERFEDEMQKARPDLGAIAREQEKVIDQTRPLFREARDEWMKLYALLDDDQVGIAKSFVQERLGRLLK